MELSCSYSLWIYVAISNHWETFKEAKSTILGFVTHYFPNFDSFTDEKSSLFPIFTFICVSYKWIQLKIIIHWKYHSVIQVCLESIKKAVTKESSAPWDVTWYGLTSASNLPWVKEQSWCYNLWIFIFAHIYVSWCF